MIRGAVVIWPDEGGHDEVATVDRISFGRDRITIILSDRRRIPLLADAYTLTRMKDRYDEARFIRLVGKPVILP